MVVQIHRLHSPLKPTVSHLHQSVQHEYYTLEYTLLKYMVIEHVPNAV